MCLPLSKRNHLPSIRKRKEGQGGNPCYTLCRSPPRDRPHEAQETRWKIRTTRQLTTFITTIRPKRTIAPSFDRFDSIRSNRATR